MLETSATLYDTLGVARTASPDIIRAAYKAQAKRFHPDAPEGDGKKFALITEAYTVLLDPGKRARYDATLTPEAQPYAAPATPQQPQDTWGAPASWGPTETPQDFATQDPRKLAGIDVWETMPITPDDLHWRPAAVASRSAYQPAVQPVEPTPAPTPSAPPIPTGQRVLWTCIWATAAIVYAMVSGPAKVGVFGLGAFLGLALFGLPRALGARGIFPKVWASLYYVFAALAALITLIVSTSMQGAAGWGIALLVLTVPLVAGYGLMIRAWGSAPLFKPTPKDAHGTVNEAGLVTREDTDNIAQWGEPGRGLNTPDSTPFTEENREKGFLGEVLTSQLIDELTVIPALRVVHSLHLPNHGQADIDHLILCGDLVVAVDSKNWSGGDYYWLSGQIMATKATGELMRRGNPMSWGLGDLAAQFPGKTLVPVIVIHSHDGRPVHTNNQGRGAHPQLMTPTEFVEQVGQWCVEQRATTVDRVALTTAVRLMA